MLVLSSLHASSRSRQLRVAPDQPLVAGFGRPVISTIGTARAASPRARCARSSRSRQALRSAIAAANGTARSSLGGRLAYCASIALASRRSRGASTSPGCAHSRQDEHGLTSAAKVFASTARARPWRRSKQQRKEMQIARRLTLADDLELLVEDIVGTDRMGGDKQNENVASTQIALDLLVPFCPAGHLGVDPNRDIAGPSPPAAGTS